MAAMKEPTKRRRNAESPLPTDEAAELQIILDRFSVQSPEGESFQNWLQSLKRSLEGRERLVAALLEALSRRPTDAGYRAFVELKGLVTEKSWVKTLKQAGYRFSQKGFRSEGEGGEARPVVLVTAEARIAQAHMAVGPTALVCLTALVSPAPASELFCISAYFEEQLNRLVVRCTGTSVKLYRELIQTMSGYFRFPLCEIPVWHAASLFKEMEEWAGGPPATAEARKAGRLLFSYEHPQRLPYVHELMQPVENPDAGMRDFKLDELYEFVPWNYMFFSREELTGLSRQVRELENSVLVVSDAIKMERVDALMGSTIRAICGEYRRRWIRRVFEELALWLSLSRRLAPARDAWLVAQHLERSTSWWKNPALQQLVYMSLGEHWPEEFGPRENSEDPSRRFHETESGLILLK